MPGTRAWTSRPRSWPTWGARLADLDRCGIQQQVIYPTIWLACLAEDVGLEAALARSYNDFMAAKCREANGRLAYAAVVPFRDPPAAVAEIRASRRWAAR